MAKGKANARPREKREKTRAEKPRLIDDPAVSEKVIVAQLREIGLRISSVLGDGNCQFRSLSDQFYGTPIHHLKLRHEVCEFLAANPDRYRSFVDEDSVPGGFEGHVATMRRQGTYGTHIELVAFAHLFRRPIKVVQPGLIYIIESDDQSPTTTTKTSKKRDSMASTSSQVMTDDEGERTTSGEPTSARTRRFNRRESNGKGKQKLEADDLVDQDETIGDETGPLYIVYHSWEHYSSVRNLNGPSIGLPHIREIRSVPSLSITSTPPADEEPNEADKLLLASLPPAQRAVISLAEIKAIITREGGWEAAAEIMIAAGFVEPPKRIAVKKAPKVIKVPPVTLNDDGTEGIRRGRGRPRRYTLSTELKATDLTTRLEQQTQPLLAANLSTNHMDDIPTLPTIDSLRGLRGHRARSPSLSDPESSPVAQRSRRDSPTTSASPSVESLTTEASSINDIEASPFPPGDALPARTSGTKKRASSALLKVPKLSSKKEKESILPHTLRGPSAREKRELARKLKGEKRAAGMVKSTRTLRGSVGSVRGEVSESVVGRVRELYI